jgi:hypothetical protein
VDMATAKAGCVIMGVIADSFLTSKTCPLWPEWSAMAVDIGDHRGHRGHRTCHPARARPDRRATANVFATGMVITPIDPCQTAPPSRQVAVSRQARLPRSVAAAAKNNNRKIAHTQACQASATAMKAPCLTNPKRRIIGAQGRKFNVQRLRERSGDKFSIASRD